MSKEIKFRIWRAPDEYSKTFWMESWDSLMNYSMSDIFQLDNPNDVLEQYTGVKDKNGKDIYEGDIIKVSDETGSLFVSVVKYFDYDDYPAFDLDPQYIPTNWYFEANILSTLKDDGTEIKVVGNVHANPELLEAQHD